MILRRKTMPTHLQEAWTRFQGQAERVEAARQALLGCLPVGRVDPAPVPVGLDLLRDELAAVAGELDAWRGPGVEDAWQACRKAVDEAVGAIPGARGVAATTGELEALLDAVAGVVEPLDAWHEAERAWLRQRQRPAGR
ncbi:MAG TPA: hypothetical protein VM324_15750 [Egibacteraceae bacterium]|nr:hypothetical protein [Egibacteraceae bacterium]